MGNKTELFAGLNSVGGYVPLLEYVTSPMKKLYIIKGSSGSGKSTIMKRIAARGESLGEDIVLIRCSSDPDSLDGVMLPALGVAVVDGTAPHTIDPKKYGIREQTVSLEKSFDYDRLDFFSGRLSRLLDKKAIFTRSAAACISACGELESVLHEYIDTALQSGKIHTFCRGFIRRHCKPGSGSVIMSPTDTFCRLGFITTGSYANPDNLYVIRDRFGTSDAVLQHLYAHGIASDVDMVVIPCPIDNRRISGIYYPSTGAMVKSDRFVPIEGGRTIKASRFLDREVIAGHRGSLNTILKLSDKLFSEAASTMGRAFEVHKEIEKIYSQCVDFDVTDAITKDLINRIFV